jgi:hypothetical protein
MLLENGEGKKLFGYIGVDGRIIKAWNLKRYRRGLWAGFKISDSAL